MSGDRRERTAVGFEHLARRRGIRLLLQFGSTITGACRPESDMDIAVLLEAGEVPLRRLIEISEELRELMPDREIDLAVVNQADALFLKRITDNCRLLFGDPADLSRLRLYAFKRYQDYRRYLVLERRFVDARLDAVCAAQRNRS